MEKLLPGILGEEMREQNVASLHTLQEQPGDLWKPLGRDGDFGMENGLLARMVERGESFLWVEINDSLGKMTEDTGQLLIME